MAASRERTLGTYSRIGKGRPVSPGDHDLFALLGRLEEPAELVLGIVNANLGHGNSFCSIASAFQYPYVPTMGAVRRPDGAS